METPAGAQIDKFAVLTSPPDFIGGCDGSRTYTGGIDQVVGGGASGIGGLGAVEKEDMSARAAGRPFGASGSVAVKWVSRRRRTGGVAAKPIGGYKKSPLDAHAEAAPGLIAARPDLTVDEIRSELRALGIRTGRVTEPDRPGMRSRPDISLDDLMPRAAAGGVKVAQLR